MPLSRLAWVSNFCIVGILSSQAISFQIFLYALFHTISLVDPSSFSQLFQLPQPYVFGNWCLHAWRDHTTGDGFELSYLQSQQHPPYYEEHCWHPINQSHPTYHPDHTTLYPTQSRVIRNNKFPCFTTVQQNWSKHNTNKSSSVASNLNPASQITHHLTPWTSWMHY